MAAEFKGSCLKQDNATFTHRNLVNVFMVFELHTWSRDLDTKFTPGDCLIGTVKLTDNAESDEYGHSFFGIGFDAYSQVLSPSGEWGKIVVISGVGNSLSLHTDYRKEDILVLDEGPVNGLDDTSVTTETRYFINITKSRDKFSLHFNSVDSFLYGNGVKF